MKQAATHLRSDAVVGELASGEGRLLFSLEQSQVKTYVAVDSSPVLLSALVERASKLDLEAERLCVIQKDLLKWTPAPETFDLLIFGAGTARLFDKTQRNTIFTSVRTALRKNGVFYVSTSESLASADRLITLGQMTLRGGENVVHFYDTALADKSAREIGFIVFPVGKPNAMARIFSSTVLNLPADELASELEFVGFSPIERIEREYKSASGIDEKTTSFIVSVEE
ncbi:class I SAM-dependent methyltransferase [Actinomyces sp. S4-C9]|uniref:class I SAM-dependent methyltransferase n=1 Tax=Actinomyces sp. S4-C9 TaxID=1219581 RepID=UPI001E473DC7|nr:class I SAM-dependent methyltransferase [Actinomyces sp. S4-C9]